ncbi:hypothetical protein FKW77_001536 [Venturia effusa]|uniref:F-box domain-containing protein n=1 Tax=Venturia effusa TaxID=50376 RepID=A0A517LPM8_9PEZI|nr:hypothetical protein FKW77_001536 [Venturia effusa]
MDTSTSLPPNSVFSIMPLPSLTILQWSATGLFTLALAIGIHVAHTSVASKKAQQSRGQSPFFDLPPELRNMVYEHLIEPEQTSHTSQPPHLTDFRRNMNFVARTLRIPPSLLPSVPKPRVIYHHLNRLSLVNRQFQSEFMDVYHRNATFYSTLDASSPGAPQHNVFTNPKASGALSRVRVASLKILATPGISGAFDPREVNSSGDWSLKNQVFEAMESMQVLRSMSLNIQAAGNQLWNPVWLWHFTSQAFKESKVMAFKKMEFTLENWHFREPNHMVRNDDGDWEWRCAMDHYMQDDIPKRLAIREFCGALYDKCDVCEPSEEALGDI